jgi:adsorption protein B
MDRWIVGSLVPLAAWILLSGLDDLFVDLVFCWQWLRVHLFLFEGLHWPSDTDLDRGPRRRIAIFVPLWHESGIIGSMLEHNLAAIRYDRYDFFLGAYPNDAATVNVLESLQRIHSNLHLALCPHDGPTSKADCLNWIYQRMLVYEMENGAHFDIVITHDAEDLIHPESLRLINFFSRSYDMVQVPVLALPTPAREFIHGLYCDDFAEFQSKDIPVRQFLGGFIPSNGVGTGFTRAVLERLAATHGNRIFEPECLTEDYENGYRIHRLGGRQIFLPIHRMAGSLAATREYFPRTFRSALKQRTRWTMGISLQSWERHGWRTPARQIYWFWRDRKGLVGNLISPLTNLLFFSGLLTFIPGVRRNCPWLPEAGPGGLRWLFLSTLALAVVHLTIRTACTTRVYGFRFACGVPARAVLGNWLNGFATVAALWRYFAARIQGQPLVWLKTDHVYPSGTALMVHKRRVGEILVARGALDAALLDLALGHKPASERIGDYLLRIGVLGEPALYEALSLQQSLPLGLPGPDALARNATRALPLSVARRWKVLPFRVAQGALFLAGPELPSDEMTQDLRRFSRLSLRYHLVTPTEFDRLARAYLSAGSPLSPAA